MIHNLEFNKFFAAILLATLVLMLAGFFSDVFFPNHKKESKRGYEIAVAQDSVTTEAVVEEEVDITKLLVMADINRGAKIAKKCSACHNFGKGQPHKIGPNLWNLLGKKAGSEAGYSYSNAIIDKNIIWDYANLAGFLENPKGYIAGTKMVAFRGLKKPKDLADVIMYLRSKADSEYPLP
jgi:cytochrome c